MAQQSRARNNTGRRTESVSEEPLLVTRMLQEEARGLFCRFVASLNPAFPMIVLGSGIARSFQGYCRGVELAGYAITAGVAIVYGFLAYFVLGAPLLFVVVSSLTVALAIVLPLFLALAYGLPVAAYNSRGSRLEAKFLVFAMAVSTLLAGGAKVTEALMTVAREFREELAEFTIELDYVASNLGLGRNPDIVLEEAARLTPSISLKNLFSGLAKAVRTGTQPLTVVEEIVEIYLSNYELLIDKATTSLGAVFEAFVSIALLVPVILGIMGLLFAIFPLAGIGFEPMMSLVTFILVPIVSAAVIVVADTIMSKLRL